MKSPNARFFGRIAILGMLGARASSGQALWVEQGPAPMLTPFAWGEQTGAIAAIAPDPWNPNRVFIASVNGGIWRTENATAVRPTWANLTDQMPSLSMGAIAFSLLDATHNTLFAGCSIESSYYGLGSLSSGLLLTMNGGNSWLQLAANVFSRQIVTRILPTAVNGPGGQVVLVATSQNAPAWCSGSGNPKAGLWRSTDSGATWNAIGSAGGLPAAPFNSWALAADPGTPARIFLAAAGGVYRSQDAGAAWVNISGPITGASSCGRLNLAMSPTPDGTGQYWLYVSVLGGSLFRSTDNGNNWTQLDSMPGGKHYGLCLAVSAANPKTAFVSDDTNNRWRVDASKSAGSQLFEVSHDNPHADPRQCAFGADPNALYQCDDGGIYRLNDPFSSSPTWASACGNLRLTEFYSIAYDSVNHVLLGGAQDEGNPHQSAANGQVWGLNDFPAYDGNAALTDNTSTPGQSIHYVGPAKPLSNFRKKSYDANHHLLSDVGVGQAVTGSGGMTIYQLPGGDAWTVPMILNAVVPARMLVNAGGFLYESFDRGQNFVQLGPGAVGSSANNIGSVNSSVSYAMPGAWVYGGMSSGTANADVLYTGTGATLRLRTSGSGLPAILASYPGGAIRSMAVDPNDWHRAYVVDAAHRAWRTTDAGATAGGWQDVTGNLNGTRVDARIIVAVSPSSAAGQEALVLGGSGGVVFARSDSIGPATFWQTFDSTFPNVIVSDLHYDWPDDVLVAGTIGRGAWTLPNASNAIFNCFVRGPVLVVPIQYPTVRAAYNAALDCNTIRIVTGTYHESPMPFRLIKRVRLESVGGPAVIRQ